VARELTKMYETFQRGTLAELLAYYQGEEPRGEITLVVSPEPESSEAGLDDAARAEAARLLAEGDPPSRVAREVARVTGLARNRAYALVQSIQAHDEGEPNE
jgi:16S rRNA (cytidine1402-2'-O)-methyltransferase